MSLFRSIANRFHIHPVVFFVSAALILLFIFAGTLFTAEVARLTGQVQTWIAVNLGWYYILFVGLLLPFALWLGLSRHGRIRLGADDEKPEFSRFSWFAMLFSAGMGIGLLFYSVAEPILHYVTPPRGEGGTTEAAKQAMNLTFYHWGLHAWAIYIVVGLALAYFHFRRGLPLSLRSALYPIIGNRIYGPIGNIVDIVAVVGTLFGVATSLGLGAMQVNSGLARVIGADESTAVRLAIIACITVVATISVVSGIGNGIRRLSELNILTGLVLLAFVFVAGPTLFILKGFVQNIGNYIQRLPITTFWTNTYGHSGWLGNWTVFYWGWWIAWSPFVGMFIARISRGRTIREFVIGVLIVPTLVTFFWLSVFGQTALHQQMTGQADLAAAIHASIPSALYVLLEQFPWATVTSFFATVVIVNFFVTSSDSGSLVIDIITAGGHPEPPTAQRVFWAILEGAVASVLLVAGGLQALQTGSITTSLPLSIVLILLCYGLVKSLRSEGKAKPGEKPKDT